VSRQELRPLQQRFRLQEVQGGVLARNAAAAAAIPFNLFICACQHPPPLPQAGAGAEPSWTQRGVQLLLQAAAAAAAAAAAVEAAQHGHG
jgi:hypothetical protein